MSSINFDNAWLLLIAVPLIAAFAIPFAIAVRKENRNGHNVASILLHVALSVVIAFAAAGTSVKTVLTETEVMVVADVSYSANRNLDKLDGIIRNIKYPSNSKVGLVCFGKDSELLNSPGSKESLKSVTESTVDDSETDIAGALSFAGDQFRSDVIKRIVLITDGRQTDESDSFAISRAVNELRMRNIKVDAIYLNDNLQPTDKEVQISAASYTKTVFLNHREDVSIEIRSNNDANVFVTLTCPEFITLAGLESDTRTQAPHITAGTNNITFTDLPTNAAGTYHYEVTVRTENPSDDANPNNNRYLFTQVVSSEVKVLVVTQSWDDVTAAVERYKDVAELDIYEKSSGSASVKNAYKSEIESANDNVKLYLNAGTQKENRVPFTVEELAKYDEIVLADMDVTDFNDYNAFIGNVQKVVSVFGKSLVTAGNLELQNLATSEPIDPDDPLAGDKQKKQEALQSLADLVPVSYGRSQDDQRLYTIVIDVSRSMNQLYHLSLAKTVAKKLVGILNPNDYVCIVAFAGEIWVKQPPAPNTNPDRLYSIIDDLEKWQGTMIASSLREAQKQLSLAGEFSGGKQIMLITDGMGYGDSSEDLSDIAAEMYNDDGVITSVFDVGRPGDGTNSGLNNANPTYRAQCQELIDITEASGGKYTHNTSAEGEISDKVFAEMTGPVTESVIERPTTVNIERRRDEVLNSPNAIGTNIPEIGGYYYTVTKPSTTTVLTANHVKSSGATSKVPLYTYWNYGNGKVSSFTSAYSGAWLDNWTEAGLDGKFFSNVYEVSVPDEKNGAPYSVNVEREGTVTRVEITPAIGSTHFSATAKVEITYPAAEGEEPVVRTADMTFGSYSYYYEFETAELGEYSVRILYEYNDNTYETLESVTIPYEPEYDSFAGYDVGVLHKAIDEGGTVSLDGKLTLENDESDLSTYTLSLVLPLLITAVVLYIIDIIVRKLKWEDIKSFFGFKKKQQKGGAGQ